MDESQSLAGQVAIITGASRGIGLALVKVLTAEGCNVVMASRSEGISKETFPGKGQAEWIRCDIRDPQSVDDLFQTVQRHYSKLDILINNAGVAHALAPIEQLSLQTWNEALATNLTGMFLCTRAALPLMNAGATIVNNLSVAASQPFAGMAAYNASKSGALGFTNVLREEQRKKGIRVLALVPGATDTAIWEQFWPDAPRAKMLSPETVAEAVLHVLKLPAEAAIEEIRMGPAAGGL